MVLQPLVSQIFKDRMLYQRYTVGGVVASASYNLHKYRMSTQLGGFSILIDIHSITYLLPFDYLQLHALWTVV